MLANCPRSFISIVVVVPDAVGVAGAVLAGFEIEKRGEAGSVDDDAIQDGKRDATHSFHLRRETWWATSSSVRRGCCYLNLLMGGGWKGKRKGRRELQTIDKSLPNSFAKNFPAVWSQRALFLAAPLPMGEGQLWCENLRLGAVARKNIIAVR